MWELGGGGGGGKEGRRGGREGGGRGRRVRKGGWEMCFGMEREMVKNELGLRWNVEKKEYFQDY